jgi:DNA-binding MarR family transcriptional regulator
METIELASSLTLAVSGLHKRLRKQMPSAQSLSITDMTTMSCLYQHQTLYPSQLADLAKIKNQSMSQVLNRLAELQLIRKVPDQNDKRKVAISLTPQGKEMVEQCRYERSDWLAGAIDTVLTEGEINVLQEAVNILNKLSNFK